MRHLPFLLFLPLTAFAETDFLDRCEKGGLSSRAPMPFSRTVSEVEVQVCLIRRRGIGDYAAALNR